MLNTQYDVINKETGHSHRVTGFTFGQNEVIVTTVIGDITFENKDQMGDLKNDIYLIKEVPKVTGTVTE